MEYELFHGADAQSMLFNIAHHGLTTDGLGQLYFSQHQWTNCLVHGADLGTRESYVARLRINIPPPPQARIDRIPRAGNPDALIVTTAPNVILPCEFLQLYVRRGTVGEFETIIIPGPGIEAYLISCFV